MGLIMRGRSGLSLQKYFLNYVKDLELFYANQVITIAKNIAENIEKRYGRASDIIPNGVEIPELSDS